MGPTAFLQFWRVVLHPAVDRRVINMQSSLAHHLLQILVTERIPEVPADTQQNNLGLEVTPFERCGGIHESNPSRFSEYRRVYSILAIFATQPLLLHRVTSGMFQHTEPSGHSMAKFNISSGSRGIFKDERI